MTLSPPDRTVLSDLVHRYAAYVDDRRFDSVATLFTETAELTVPDPPHTLNPTHAHRGRQAIAAAVTAVAQVERTQHAIVGEIYDASGAGAARGRIACIAHHWSRRPDAAAANGIAEWVNTVWHLRYDDEYRLTGEGWRISGRALIIQAIETRPVRRLLPHQ